MIYKIVPGPQAVSIKGGNFQSACDLFADIINREAAGGWKYVAMETIETQETKGCIKKEVEVNYIYMLIFGKEN